MVFESHGEAGGFRESLTLGVFLEEALRCSADRRQNTIHIHVGTKKGECAGAHNHMRMASRRSNLGTRVAPANDDVSSDAFMDASNP